MLIPGPSNVDVAMNTTHMNSSTAASFQKLMLNARLNICSHNRHLTANNTTINTMVSSTLPIQYTPISDSSRLSPTVITFASINCFSLRIAFIYVLTSSAILLSKIHMGKRIDIYLKLSEYAGSHLLKIH